MWDKDEKPKNGTSLWEYCGILVVIIVIIILVLLYFGPTIGNVFGIMPGAQ